MVVVAGAWLRQAASSIAGLTTCAEPACPLGSDTAAGHVVVETDGKLVADAGITVGASENAIPTSSRGTRRWTCLLVPPRSPKAVRWQQRLHGSRHFAVGIVRTR